MKRLLLMVGIALIYCGISAPEKALADKEKFIETGCNRCHSITAASVEKKTKSGDDSEDEDTADLKPPDLSHVAKYHDEAFLTKFLNKEIEHGKEHDGVASDYEKKKHPKKFKGTPDELSAMVKWLETLK